ncbi:MAG: hypothetical protein HY912_00755 [Desulfomonile tiedjei]|uniref:Uncharacterized protein n=1 Tax=Desulfomonile tiedjei TaxID=2358 RepID=A0A9D6Z497_9BACT|nr:hypothetical protein [Desulfomonile tiedjei]
MTEQNRPPGQDQVPLEQQPEEEPEEDVIDVTFLDRVLAFLGLIYPFSLAVDKMQELLQNTVGSSVNNMLVLVCLIVFLVLVNRVAKMIYALRKRK